MRYSQILCFLVFITASRLDATAICILLSADGFIVATDSQITNNGKIRFDCKIRTKGTFAVTASAHYTLKPGGKYRFFEIAERALRSGNSVAGIDRLIYEKLEAVVSQDLFELFKLNPRRYSEFSKKDIVDYAVAGIQNDGVFGTLRIVSTGPFFSITSKSWSYHPVNSTMNVIPLGARETYPARPQSFWQVQGGIDGMAEKAITVVQAEKNFSAHWFGFGGVGGPLSAFVVRKTGGSIWKTPGACQK